MLKFDLWGIMRFFTLFWDVVKNEKFHERHLRKIEYTFLVGLWEKKNFIWGKDIYPPKFAQNWIKSSL